MTFADTLAAQLTSAPAVDFQHQLAAALASLAAQQLAVEFTRDADGLTVLVQVFDLPSGALLREITPERDADGFMTGARVDIH